MSNAKQNIESPFLSIAEAAEFLKIGRHSMYDLVAQGRIIPRKHGGKKVFTHDDLMDWSNASKSAHAKTRREPISKFQEARQRVRLVRSLTTELHESHLPQPKEEYGDS